MKIAFLIPSKSMKKWKNLNDSFLMKYLIPSVMNTITTEHKYTIYYAIDDNDKLYSKLQTRKKILNKDTYKQFNKNIDMNIKILSTKNIEKGNVVGYWNMLFEEAYKDGNISFNFKYRLRSIYSTRYTKSESYDTISCIQETYGNLRILLST